MIVLLVVLALGFAFSMGAHYTGACMGIPYALRAISARRALLVMAPLTLLGATFASHKVERTVGHGLLAAPGLPVTGLVIIIGVAFGLTSLFNVVRIPTSTVQILVFSVVGVGLAARNGVRWSTIGALAVIWVTAPVAAGLLGYALTRALDLVPAIRAQTRVTGRVLAGVADGHPRGGPAGTDAPGTADPDSPGPPGAQSAGGTLAAGLITVGALASFTMGSNDVANATGSPVGTGEFSPLAAGLLGGLGLAVGVLTWGRPLLHKVAFNIVTVDRPMVTAAQLVQAAIVLAAVAFGFFTSMNQALIATMTGAAAARGRRTVHAAALYGCCRTFRMSILASLELAFARA